MWHTGRVRIFIREDPTLGSYDIVLCARTPDDSWVLRHSQHSPKRVAQACQPRNELTTEPSYWGTIVSRERNIQRPVSPHNLYNCRSTAYKAFFLSR